MSVVKQLYDLLETRERWQLGGLAICMVFMAILETVGVASILPFMKVIADPDIINENRWLSSAYHTLNFGSLQSFLMFLGLMVLVAITVNNGFSAMTTWLMFRFAWSQNHRLSTRLLSRYLCRPYTYFLSRNTSNLGKNVLSEVQIVIQGVMLASLKFTSKVLVAILIICLIAFIDPTLALIVGLVLGGAYGIVYVALRSKQRRLGRERLLQNGRRFQMASEALSGIKELKVLGRERSFLRRFKDPSWKYCRASASNQVVGSLPRYALETIAFGGVLLILLYNLRTSSSIGQVLPILSLYVFAGYRLMPALNDIFSAAVQIRFNREALSELHADIVESDADLFELPNLSRLDVEKVILRKAVTFNGVGYSYPGAATSALKGVDLSIGRHQIVGFVGKTGAGKTTLVDLLLGLLKPTEGRISVDDVELEGERRLAWRQSCGYIPQELFLCDDSIRANIAFGVPEGEVDETALERAAQMAQISEFIHGLPKGYDTLIGERGVRLSGGQRQRIGIARALYHDPDVLVMDEATSSLDGATEAEVMEMIHRLGQIKTLIIIAHRLSTVRACDTIFLLQNGEVVASGTYEELEQTNESFRTIAGLEIASSEQVL